MVFSEVIGGVWNGRVVVGECGTDRAAQIARDTGPSTALSRDGAHTYAAPLATPCGQTSLTRSRAAGTPIRATVHLVAQTRRNRVMRVAKCVVLFHPSRGRDGGEG